MNYLRALAAIGASAALIVIATFVARKTEGTNGSTRSTTGNDT